MTQILFLVVILTLTKRRPEHIRSVTVAEPRLNANSDTVSRNFGKGRFLVAGFALKLC